MSAQLKSHTDGQTMVLTLSNPAQRNALGPSIYPAGIEALNAAESNASVRSVVLTGDGPWFCAGASLQRLQTNRALEPQVAAESVRGLNGWIEAIRAFPKPVIAAVEGAAAGAGFALTLACDLVIAARNAIFAASYTNIGLSPDGGLTWQLAQMLPRQIITEWLMGGEHIAAQRLHELGVVNTLTDAGQALPAALALATRLNERASNTLASVKELLNDAYGTTLNAQLAKETSHFVCNLHHPNAGIGINAFLAKEKPRYP
ncbi:MAG: enoyl-CoA hydratase [Burkholderiaceae bacterium]|nr:enoyl-CoA hydratase [Burkholderiaceae bacterium]